MNKERNIKAILFCTVGFLTLLIVVTTTNFEGLLTSINQNKEEEIVFSNYKNANVVLTTDDFDFNEVTVNPYNVLSYEKPVLDKNVILDYEVTFANSDGKVEYVFYLDNNSNKDAILQNFKMPDPMCQGFDEDCEKYLDGITYTLNYYDSNMPVNVGDTILAHDRVKVVLTLEYNVNEKVPSSSATFTDLGFSLGFVEK